jgi:hypothetical protein
MTDIDRDTDTELTRLFAELAAPDTADETFVARVGARIVLQRRIAIAIPLGAALLLALAIWATWPAPYLFSLRATGGVALIAEGVDRFFNSPVGMATAAALLFTAALSAWLYEQVRR